MRGAGHHVVDKDVERSRRFLDMLHLKMSGPEIPSLNVATHMGLVAVVPQMSKVLFYRPRAADLQIHRPQRGKLLMTPSRHILLTPQPQILGALQQGLTGLGKLAVLIVADLVHRLQHVAHHVEPIKNDLLGRIRVPPQVHRHRRKPAKLLPAKLPVGVLQALPSALIPNKLHRTPSMS